MSSVRRSVWPKLENTIARGAWVPLCIQEDAVFEGSTILAPMLLCTLQCLIFTFREEKLLRGLLEETERSRIMASSWRTSSIVMPLARSLTQIGRAHV